MGTNNVCYKHVYYIAKCNCNCELLLDMNNMQAIIIGAAIIIAALLFQYFSDYKVCARKYENFDAFDVEKLCKK